MSNIKYFFSNVDIDTGMLYDMEHRLSGSIVLHSHSRICNMRGAHVYYRK